MLLGTGVPLFKPFSSHLRFVHPFSGRGGNLAPPKSVTHRYIKTQPKFAVAFPDNFSLLARVHFYLQSLFQEGCKQGEDKFSSNYGSKVSTKGKSLKKNQDQTATADSYTMMEVSLSLAMH